MPEAYPEGSLAVGGTMDQVDSGDALGLLDEIVAS
jgi:hypothetical protein